MHLPVVASVRETMNGRGSFPLDPSDGPSRGHVKSVVGGSTVPAAGHGAVAGPHSGRSVHAEPLVARGGEPGGRRHAPAANPTQAVAGAACEPAARHGPHAAAAGSGAVNGSRAR